MKRIIRLTIVALAAMCILGVPGALAAENPASFVLHLDTIPNFAQNPTIQSAQNGKWSSASTWNPARLPQAGDIVLIKHEITYDSLTGEADVIGIDASAALRFATNQPTRLRVGTLLVMPDGTLEVGTTAAPIPANVTAEIIIKDLPLDLTNDGVGVYDPEQFGTGIVVVDGAWTMHGATKSPTFVRLSEESLAGSTTLSLSAAVSGWLPGDRLILPDTRHLLGKDDGKNYVGQWEELSIASISGDGKTITLTAPLQFDHTGARDADGNLEYLPHIGNMTRNIIIRSENPNGTRGHTQTHHNADLDIRYAAFRELGRTLNNVELDNTTFNSDGSVARIGTNQIARYPLHTHRLRGPSTPQPNGYQFTLIGNVVDGGSAAHNFKWSLVIHGSHYGLIRENLVYNAMGAGISFEDGSESYNVLEDNFVVRVNGTGLRADRGCGENCGREGVAYWFHGPNNYIRNNVAANVNGKSAFTIFVKNAGDKNIPAYQGADPNDEGQFQTVNLYAIPLLEFVGNEAYGASQRGLTYWWIGSKGAGTDGPQDVARSYIRDFVIWHVKVGVYGYPTHRLTFDRIIIRGDKATVRKTPSWGLDFQDYLQKDLIIQNADIQGVRTGIEAPLLVEPKETPGIGFTTVQDSLIRAYYGITVFQPWHNTNPTGLNPREIHVRNVKFVALDIDPISQNSPPYPAINMDPKTIKSNIIVGTKVFVYDYNQIAGDDFQVFALEQAPDAIVPESTLQNNGNPQIIGSPVAGLTNTQTMAQYGIAYGGEVAPCLDNTSRPEIRGFVCDAGSSSNPPPDTTPPVMPVGFTVM